MPWTANDAGKHNSSLSTSSKERWARIANAVLASTQDEGLAIRTANSRVKPSNPPRTAIRRKLTHG